MLQPAPLSRRFSVAPMMDWTDRHCRAFHRALTRRGLLYTEMVTSAAAVHGDAERLLGFDPCEQPVALQLGGSEPEELARAARLGESFGYAEINLNVGCPSDRVQSGRFGACLMREPGLVAECLSAMRAAVSVPVTVKHRLGVDDQDPEESLFSFVETVRTSGVTSFAVHARKAWLKGLSPKENRDVPPLDYALVRRLKAAYPELEIILNGGLETPAQAAAALAPQGDLPGLDGVMLGRAAYHTPAILAEVDGLFFGDAGYTDEWAQRLNPADAALARYVPFVAQRLEAGVRLHAMTRHMLGLFHGRPGARGWRRVLSEEAVGEGAGFAVLAEAYARLGDADPQLTEYLRDPASGRAAAA